MIFNKQGKNHPGPKQRVKISNTDLEEVREVTFLGIVIDNKLSWAPHLKYITSKAAKGVGILSKLRKSFGSQTMKTVYYSLIYPFITNGIVFWGSSPAAYIDPLIKIQKRAVRIIVGAQKLAHTNPLFVRHELLKIPDLYIYFLLVFMHNVMNNKVPKHLAAYFCRNREYKTRITRQSDDFFVPFAKSHVKYSSLFVQAPLVFNRLRKEIDYKCSRHSLKKRIKHLFINKYK